MAQLERALKSQSRAEARFQEYVAELLNNICYTPGFGISYVTPDSIRDNWHQRVKMNEATKTRILDHARVFIAMTPRDLVVRKCFLESLARRMGEYLAPYFMRDTRYSNVERTMSFLKNELYDKCTCVQSNVHRIKDERQKSVKGHERVQKKRAAKKFQKEKAQRAFAAVQQAKETIVVINGKRYVKTLY